MIKPTAGRLDAIASGLVLCALLSGCFPIPILPGFESGSRKNIGERAADFIVPAQTTRAEVLLRLGEPDGMAPDESWASYGCAIGKGGAVLLGVLAGTGPGGVAAVGAGTESVMYRRLVVRFDEQGIVTTSQIETKVCREYGGGGGGVARSHPCMDITGSDLAVATIAAADDGSVQQYTRAILWNADATDRRRGELTINRTSIVFLIWPADNEPASALRIPFTEIESVSVASLGLGVRAMVVKKKDHSRESFTIMGSVFPDGNQTDAAAALIQKLIEGRR